MRIAHSRHAAGDVEKRTDTKSCVTILGCKERGRYLALRDGAMALAIISVLVGIALGLRFNVVALAAVISLAVMFVLIIGVGRGESFWSIVLAVVTVGMAIKLGYFVGIFLTKRIR
jgi:hypothetical protein